MPPEAEPNVSAGNNDALRIINADIRMCEKCRLSETRNLAVPGEGPEEATLMFVGEAPGHVNDRDGRPFVGHGGRVFDGILAAVGIQRDQVFVTNAGKCWPPENRRPRPDELRACRHHLDLQITTVRPRLVFAFGTTAFMQLTGAAVKMKEEHGQIAYRDNIPVCATFHPNGIRYIKGGRQTIVTDIRQALATFGLLPDGATSP